MSAALILRAALLRMAAAAVPKAKLPAIKILVRNSSDITGWHYRMPRQDVPKKHIYIAEGIMAFTWYWILWHCWYDSGHLLGHFPYPDPSKWTDEELGIPPINED